jgi:hypothetical protein
VFSDSGHGDRVDVFRSMIPALYLAVAAVAILAAHLRHAPPPFRPGIFSRWYGEPDAPAPVTAPPVPVVDPVADKPAAAPRKRTPRKTSES